MTRSHSFHSRRVVHILASLLIVMLVAIGISPVAAATPSNDDFDDAADVVALPFTHIVDTTDATTADDDPFCFGQGPTVWYQFTPAEDIRLEANTFGSDYDTTLGVYTGTRGNLTEVACNDDAAGTFQSRVRFDAVAGITYFFMVGAFASGPGGLLQFNLIEAPPAPPSLEVGVSINPVGSVVAKNGTVTISGTVTCSRPVIVDLFGHLEQRAGRLLIRGFFGDFVECNGATSWSATFQGDNGIFKAGKASVSVFAFAFDTDEDEFAFASVEGPVRLKGSKR